jgi:hypothetical protein
MIPEFRSDHPLELLQFVRGPCLVERVDVTDIKLSHRDADTIGGHDQASSTPWPADLLRPPLLLARVGRILVGADADALAAWFDRLTMSGVELWRSGVGAAPALRASSPRIL